ncbi:jhy protein homolog isoform X2 [Anarrhichthys ocellatus]|uniref:jhy protein homolog isoform X2 n=1 Tax=Anarrhichthys ocellatus TaxID=433405 RepID=UPI0012EE9B8B|nr:jhy protein homolog isoform X2 [Anarrhichthys ocellatus]
MVALLRSADRKTVAVFIIAILLQTSPIECWMDKGLKHEKMSQMLKTEQEKHPSPRPAVLADQRDSVESDTESLAHERTYQQQLQMRNDQIKYTLPEKKNAEGLQQGDEDACNDDETEDHQVYDSLDTAAHPHDKHTPTLLQTEYLDTHMDEREGTSQLLTDDAYNDLRYDPNWRTNLRGAGHFNESPHISVEEYYQVPKEKPGQSRGDSQGPVVKGGYRYIIDTSPALLVTPDMAGNEPDQPYRLHPDDVQTSTVTSPHCYNHTLQLQSPEADHSKPSCSITKNESDESLLKGFRAKYLNSCDNAGENASRSPELTKDIHAMYSLQELRHTQGGPTQIQQMSTFPKVLFNKKLERLPEDIVERNKTTLGRNTSTYGSYASVHVRKQDMPHNVNKVTQISERKKAQRKEYPKHLQPQQQPSAPGVKADWGDCLSSPLAGPAAITQPNPQKTTPSQPLLPTIHLNINLNTSSHLLPLIQQRGQNDINLASLHGCSHWSLASENELALSPGCQQIHPRMQIHPPKTSSKTSSQMRRGVNAHLHHRDLESCSEERQRTAALKWPLTCEGEDQQQAPQNLLRTPTTSLSLGSGSYPLLSAIGKSMTGKEPELSPDGNTDNPVHRSSSNGYLVQMEKQKQRRVRVTYKAYSLKDYKQLKSDINLRGLGPDYTAMEETKLKRQKLYSNVIREQNKKISRIPFLLAKDPEGNDKKVPRMKALEYAKTIAKPPVQSQPKQRQKHRSEGFTEHASYLDVSQLATLEVLRKRHEEEKQAVALFRKVPAV